MLRSPQNRPPAGLFKRERLALVSVDKAAAGANNIKGFSTRPRERLPHRSQ
jgi:hypothetical protein